MSLCVNPEETRVRVVVPGGAVIIICRPPSTEEIIKFRKKRFSAEINRNKTTYKDQSNEMQLWLINLIMIDAKAEDDAGMPTELTYQLNGEEAVLNPEVENWKEKIPATVKIAAGQIYGQDEAEFQEDTVKN